MTGADQEALQSLDESDFVEYCIANVSRAERRRIESANIPSRGTRCLDHCGTCYREFFLVVNGGLVTGEASDRLIAALGDGENS